VNVGVSARRTGHRSSRRIAAPGRDGRLSSSPPRALPAPPALSADSAGCRLVAAGDSQDVRGAEGRTALAALAARRPRYLGPPGPLPPSLSARAAANECGIGRASQPHACLAPRRLLDAQRGERSSRRCRGAQELAGYMLRASMSLQKMTYDAATGTVIYRSKMHAGLKRNFQVMPGAQWLWGCFANTFPTATSTWCATWGGTRTAHGTSARRKLPFKPASLCLRRRPGQ
jgi:hypothetical protein